VARADAAASLGCGRAIRQEHEARERAGDREADAYQRVLVKNQDQKATSSS
jgi:hypothetical protein